MPLVREALNAASKDEQAVSRATGQQKLETALERSFCAPRGAQNPSNVWYVLF